MVVILLFVKEAMWSQWQVHLNCVCLCTDGKCVMSCRAEIWLMLDYTCAQDSPRNVVHAMKLFRDSRPYKS